MLPEQPKRRGRPPKALGVDSVAGLSAYQRENPDALTGSDLRHLAYSRGIAKSQLASMSDEKIREQLKYLTYRQYDDAVE